MIIRNGKFVPDIVIAMPVGIKNYRQQIVKIFVEIFHYYQNLMMVIYGL